MMKRVFSWKRFVTAVLKEDAYEDDILSYHDFIESVDSNWVDECIGKTPAEIRDIGYAYEDDWFEEIEETATAEDFEGLEIGTSVKVVCDGYTPNTFTGEFIAVRDDIVIVAIPEDVVPNFYDCEVSLAYDGFRPDFCEIIKRRA